jgi:hypothetical protein
MKRRSETHSESDTHLRQALYGLMCLKLRTGSTTRQLRDITDSCIKEAMKTYGSASDSEGLDIHRLGSVLRTWHKETRYLSKEGTPIPLRLTGPVSLDKLIGTFYPRDKTKAVFRTLKEAGLVRSIGRSRWIATASHAQISNTSQETLDHVSEGVSRFLETVLNNTSTGKKTDLLFEQSCKVRNLPTGQARAFRGFVRQQALAFLTSVDDWLEARVTPSKPKSRPLRSRAAGVFTFAYMDAANKKARRSKGNRHTSVRD